MDDFKDVLMFLGLDCGMGLGIEIDSDSRIVYLRSEIGYLLNRILLIPPIDSYALFWSLKDREHDLNTNVILFLN